MQTELPKRGADESCRARTEIGESVEGVSADGTATRRLTKTVEVSGAHLERLAKLSRWRRNSHGEIEETFRTKTQSFALHLLLLVFSNVTLTLTKEEKECFLNIEDHNFLQEKLKEAQAHECMLRAYRKAPQAPQRSR
ncbi:hypothetical protein PIB30_017602 [Stylosanthes scabra]|uniref:Uncharacterized protein n=1 Tax=Stylosanthes scabra TaxID=79078 RepID=A0ABU6U6G7_9FABA|nr:hypothetical protein [Stylosanthes scabra]